MVAKQKKDIEIYGDMLPSEYYNSRLSERRAYEDRAEKFAELSMPAMFRKTGSGGSDSLPDKYSQSLVAKLVKNLSSKITLTLFPPSASGFRLDPDGISMEQLTQGDESMVSEVRASLSVGSDLINREIEAQDIRKFVFGLVDYQLVIGSCIMEKVPKRGIKVHGLRNIAVTLDDVGEAIRMCVFEELNRLPEGVEGVEPKPLEETYELYTMSTWMPERKKWEVVQEIDGVVVSSKEYSDKKHPFAYQGMVWNVGEPLHRPYIEDFIGSISAYDKLSKVLTDGSLIASKSLTFVNERGGRTRKKDVAESENGAVIDGVADDVTSFQHQKNFDFQVPMQVRAELRSELEDVFLAKNSITRQAERVTAEEIREMAQELETALAGVYAIISNRITKRIVTWVMDEIGIEFKTIDVKIITGLNALGMNNEIMKLDGFMTRLGQLQKVDWIKDKELIDRYAEGYGVNTVNLLKTPQEFQRDQQAMQEQMAMQQMAQSGAQSAGETAGKQLAGGQQQ